MLDPRLEPAMEALKKGEGAIAVRLVRVHLANLPSDATAIYLHGTALKTYDPGDEPVRWFLRSIGLMPGSAIPLAAVASVFIERADRPAAARFFRRSLALEPGSGIYAVSLSTSVERTDVAPGKKWLVRARAIDPLNPVAHGNLGIALRRRGRLDEAGRESRKALALQPEQPESLNNLAILAIRGERLAETETWTTRAMAYRAGFAEGIWNRAVARLLAGRLAEAWPDAEARFDVPGAQKHHYSRERRWRGETAPGRTLLTFAEQGLGDTVHFCRFAPLAARRGVRTILAVQPRLVRLLKTLRGVDEVVAADGNEPHHDWNCPLMSLPGIFGTTVDTIPAAIPYLAANEAGRLAWRARLDATKALRVGLAWQGNPGHLDDDRRSFPLSALDGLRRMTDIQFVAMRVTPEPLPSEWPAMLDAAAWQKDMADTADLLAELDLLITCDTAVAHVAGALGRPVWTLLAHAADWRWMTKRADTPWYPTMRLFRQPRPGDWRSVAGEVERALAAMDRHTPGVGRARPN